MTLAISASSITLGMINSSEEMGQLFNYLHPRDPVINKEGGGCYHQLLPEFGPPSPFLPLLLLFFLETAKYLELKEFF